MAEAERSRMLRVGSAIARRFRSSLDLSAPAEGLLLGCHARESVIAERRHREMQNQDNSDLSFRMKSVLNDRANHTGCLKWIRVV